MSKERTETALAALTDDELKAELWRRGEERMAAYWEERKRKAKYVCYACGMPDSHHTKDCPSDMVCL